MGAYRIVGAMLLLNRPCQELRTGSRGLRNMDRQEPLATLVLIIFVHLALNLLFPSLK